MLMTVHFTCVESIPFRIQVEVGSSCYGYATRCHCCEKRLAAQLKLVIYRSISSLHAIHVSSTRSNSFVVYTASKILRKLSQFCRYTATFLRSRPILFFISAVNRRTAVTRTDVRLLFDLLTMLLLLLLAARFSLAWQHWQDAACFSVVMEKSIRIEWHRQIE